MSKQGIRTGYTCGTRAIVVMPGNDFRVVCATCGAGDTVPHRVMETAMRACVRDSSKPCRACGAN